MYQNLDIKILIGNLVNNVNVDYNNKGDFKVNDQIKIVKLLERTNGLTITEVVDKSGSSRSAVRILLARLEGAGKVFIRKVGMAKVYFLKEDKNEKNI